MTLAKFDRSIEELLHYLVAVKFDSKYKLVRFDNNSI